MKKSDLVRLTNSKPYERFNLTQDMYGIVVDVKCDNADVLFFNPQNVGDYAIVNVKLADLELGGHKLPIGLEKEFLAKSDDIVLKAKSTIDPIKIKEYDIVELIKEDEKYFKFGIHKGERGCVVDNNAVQNYIEVDFSGVNEKGEFKGDCISVKIEDLKVIK